MLFFGGYLPCETPHRPKGDGGTRSVTSVAERHRFDSRHLYSVFQFGVTFPALRNGPPPANLYVPVLAIGAIPPVNLHLFGSNMERHSALA